mmetsp:Transcript_3003/g.8779  ORF Transcript_3003/g.8779 Transcript_3003/m.8779 type:complete len:303 (+) Transcript_3003:391-1299(+)
MLQDLVEVSALAQIGVHARVPGAAARERVLADDRVADSQVPDELLGARRRLGRPREVALDRAIQRGHVRAAAGLGAADGGTRAHGPRVVAGDGLGPEARVVAAGRVPGDNVCEAVVRPLVARGRPGAADEGRVACGRHLGPARRREVRDEGEPAVDAGAHRGVHQFEYRLVSRVHHVPDGLVLAREDVRLDKLPRHVVVGVPRAPHGRARAAERAAADAVAGRRSLEAIVDAWREVRGRELLDLRDRDAPCCDDALDRGPRRPAARRREAPGPVPPPENADVEPENRLDAPPEEPSPPRDLH